MEMYPVLVLVCAIFLTPKANLMHTECDVIYQINTRRYIANCSDHKLQHIPYDLHHNIKVLDLHNNKLVDLQADSFAKYDDLTELYLQNNSIRVIRDNAFTQLQQLRVLDLSVNELTSVPSSAFDGMSSLRHLNLKGNRIANIQNAAFADLVNLRALYLNGNYIESIEPEAFVNLEYLECLDLTYNNMRYLDKSIVHYFTHRLKTLKLYHNPWVCNCKIRWLEDYLIGFLPTANSTPGDHYVQWRFLDEEPICNGPPALKGKPFYDLKVEDFMCQIQMYSSGHEVIMEVGKDAQLYCKYVSDPHEEPTWTKNGKVIKGNSNKYIISTKVSSVVTSVLTIVDFQKSDIAEFACRVENARGPEMITYTVTLEGIDPAAYKLPVSEDPDSPQNHHTLTIAMSVIGGFLFLLLTMGLLIYAIMRCRRNQRKLLEQRSLRFKEHLKTNVLNNSEITEIKELEKPDIIQSEQDEPDPLYDHVQRTEDNTYVSFKSEFVEPEEMQQLYTGTNRTKGSDGSQCESTSPLLDNCIPIMCDSHDLLYETSNGSTIYTPALLPKANTLNSRYLPPMSPYDTYSSYTPYSTISHCCSPRDTSTPSTLGQYRNKSASATYLGPVPPKKPPRMFNSGDSMSLSVTSSSGSETGHLKLSLPKPGTVDEFGTAV